jgi:hypothetical protein
MLALYSPFKRNALLQQTFPYHGEVIITWANTRTCLHGLHFQTRELNTTNKPDSSKYLQWCKLQ